MQPIFSSLRLRTNKEIMSDKRNTTRRAVQEDPYDFSGPLWQKYFNETRSKARFPRGYKEVFSVDTTSKLHGA